MAHQHHRRAHAVARGAGQRRADRGPGSHYAPPCQRLSKLEAAREQAHDALATAQRQRAAEVAENAAWGTTINNLGARVSVHRRGAKRFLTVGGLAGVQAGSYDVLTLDGEPVTTPEQALAAVQARYIPRIPHAPNPACRPG